MPMVALLPVRLRPWPNPTVVVVLPSPSGVGVTAETTTYLARGRVLSSSMAARSTLATPVPWGSSRCGPIPMPAATSSIGFRCAARPISRLDGTVVVDGLVGVDVMVLASSRRGSLVQRVGGLLVAPRRLLPP